MRDAHHTAMLFEVLSKHNEYIHSEYLHKKHFTILHTISLQTISVESGWQERNRKKYGNNKNKKKH